MNRIILSRAAAACLLAFMPLAAGCPIVGSHVPAMNRSVVEGGKWGDGKGFIRSIEFRDGRTALVTYIGKNGPFVVPAAYRLGEETVGENQLVGRLELKYQATDKLRRQYREAVQFWSGKNLGAADGSKPVPKELPDRLVLRISHVFKGYRLHLMQEGGSQFDLIKGR